jgi:gluconokinase
MDLESADPGSASGIITVLMGVSGSGKTLIGEALARSIGGRFIEGDRYHPPANISRMASGQPLRDEDRWGWLDAIAGEIEEADRAGATLVVACSALKRAYRDRLRAASERILFIYLEVSRDTAAARVAARRGHFMPPSLIDSQFAALQPPAPDEQALYLDAASDPASLVDRALAAIRDSLSPATPSPA